MSSMTIADAARKSLTSFDAISQISTAHVAQGLNNEDNCSRYKIWASNLGSMHAVTDRRSADYRLREAPEVIDRVVELLEELTEINSEILEILSGERTNREISEPKDDLGSPDELSELHLSVGDILTSLFKVSMLVKRATKRDRYAKAASATDDPFLAEFDIRHIADKYPKIRMQPWLLERLGKAITQRRQFLRYCRNHKNRIAHVAPTNIPGDGLLTRPLHTDATLVVPILTENAASTTNTPLTRPTLSPTTASTTYPDKIVRDDLQDLEDGEDAVSQVTSIAYSQADQKDPGLLHVPRLEDVSQGGQPFECPFCFGIVLAKRQRSWRKHVLSDLRAYVCISQDCDAGLFEDKVAWQTHDSECHQRQWCCQHCRIEPFNSASGLQDHIRSMHDGGNFPTDVLAQMVDASTNTLVEVVPDCPLCDFEVQVRAKATHGGQGLSSFAKVVVPLADYHRHMTFHQEQLALFAIPPAIERSVESESTHGRSRIDPDEHVQTMNLWQSNLSDTEDDVVNAEPITVGPAGMPKVQGLGGSPSISDHGDYSMSQVTTVGDTSIYMPEEDQFPSILPGDIVYIPQQTGGQLQYKKGVYLGRINGEKQIVREWATKQEVEVSVPALVRKTSVTDEEKAEAQSLRASSTLQDRDGQTGLRHYRKNILLSPQTIAELTLKASQLEKGEVEWQGYDDGLVRPIFSRFLQEINTRSIAQGLPLEDVVRIMYATATLYLSEDNTSSDQFWKADVERSASLLMNVLITIFERHSDISQDTLAQLVAERAQMIARANEAVKEASGQVFKPSLMEAQDTIFDDDIDSFELDSQTLDALKLRAQDVGSGKEQLPGFGDNDVRRTFATFSRHLEARPMEDSLLSVIIRNFERCALLKKDTALDDDSMKAVVLRQKALLLSLLISVDARLQSEHHGSAPRIRTRFTSLLMEERAKLLTTVSELQGKSIQNPSVSASTDLPREKSPSAASSFPHTDIPTEEVEIGHSVVPYTERPPRVMKCYQCQHSWASTIASDLRDCPECGYYSGFAESPRRTASPDNTASPHRLQAPGEEALGQYFSERTDKYMSLYRGDQSLPGSKDGSSSSFPDPWKHLHRSSSTSPRKTSEIGPTADPPADPQLETCYTCHHRLPDWTEQKAGICQRCGSSSTEPSDVRAAAAETAVPDEAKASSRALDLAPQHLVRIIDDIEDAAADLKLLQDRDSRNVADVLVAAEQLLSIAASFKVLVTLGEDSNHQTRFQHVQDVLHILCSSIQYTLATASDALRIPLDETQWMLLCSQMSTVENVDILERLRWYQASITGILEHVEGYTSTNSSATDAQIELLLNRQQNVRKSKSRSTSDAAAAAARPSEPDNASDTKDYRLERKRLQQARMKKLSWVTSDAEIVFTRLQILTKQHPDNNNNNTDTPTTIARLRDVCDSFALLNKHHENPQHDRIFDPLHSAIAALCGSMQYTLDDMLEVLSGDLNNATWKSWVLLTARMSEVEKAGLLERLQWYSEVLEQVFYRLDRFSRPTDQLSTMLSKVAGLLELQESETFRETS